MKPRLFLAILSVCLALPLHAQENNTDAQENTARLYDPSADAQLELRAALAQSAATGRHILLQIGGNWCSWCHKLDRLFTTDQRIDSLLQADYVSLRVNYSEENKNENLLARLESPQRFGFPVLVILDSSGRLLHTQDTGLLEKDGAHDPEQVYRVLYLWRPDALFETLE